MVDSECCVRNSSKYHHVPAPPRPRWTGQSQPRSYSRYLSRSILKKLCRQVSQQIQIYQHVLASFVLPSISAVSYLDQYQLSIIGYRDVHDAPPASKGFFFLGDWLEKNIYIPLKSTLETRFPAASRLRHVSKFRVGNPTGRSLQGRLNNNP